MTENEQASARLLHGRKNPKFLLGVLAIAVTVVIVFFYYLSTLNEPPRDFPLGQTITIEKGSSIKDTTALLSEKNAVRSSLYLQYVLQKEFADAFIHSGAYIFPEKLTTQEVAQAITSGEYSSPADENVITFPEGFRIRDMYTFLPKSYEGERVDRFLEYEGYLFPDTYYIESDQTLDDIVHLMRTNFEKRIEPLKDEINSSFYSLDEIVTLASILEREGNTKESMRTIAGILIKRLENDMPLQVDATFGYVLDKTSAELTEADLNMDSPYNTYRNTGLPPTPISNPGLMAIKAVLNPIETEYLFYLSDDDGTFHYAKNFEGHKQNKFQHLQ